MTAILLEKGPAACGCRSVQTSLPYDEKQPRLSFVASSLWQFLRRCPGVAAMFAPTGENLSKNRAAESFPSKKDEIDQLVQQLPLLAIAT